MQKEIKEKNRKIQIFDKDELYRRIHPDHQIKGRISSAAFKSKKPISVDIAKLTTPKKSINDHPRHWLSSLLAGFVRSLDFEIYHRPELNNFAHAEIEGNMTPSKAKKLARKAKIILKKE